MDQFHEAIATGRISCFDVKLVYCQGYQEETQTDYVKMRLCVISELGMLTRSLPKPVWISLLKLDKVAFQNFEKFGEVWIVKKTNEDWQSILKTIEMFYINVFKATPGANYLGMFLQEEELYTKGMLTEEEARDQKWKPCTLE